MLPQIRNILETIPLSDLKEFIAEKENVSEKLEAAEKDWITIQLEKILKYENPAIKKTTAQTVATINTN